MASFGTKVGKTTWLVDKIRIRFRTSAEDLTEQRDLRYLNLRFEGVNQVRCQADTGSHQ
jgi:hypothetical protein